jgi:hypothetical protein
MFPGTGHRTGDHQNRRPVPGIHTYDIRK